MKNNVKPPSQEKERIARSCPCCSSQELRKSPAILMPFISDRVFGWAPVTIDDSWGLTSIPTGHAFSLCNSLCCQKCGFLFLDIRFSETELARLYDDYRGEKYTHLREKYEPGYRERNQKLNDGIDYIPTIENFLLPYLDPSLLEKGLQILDWGGDTGKNTPFRRAPHSIDIYEISQKIPLPGCHLVTKEIAFNKNYDLVICSNVLEHVPYPQELIIDITQAMHRDSLLYLEIPYEALMEQRLNFPELQKKHWHEHINFYSEKSIRQLLKKCGLQLQDLHILSAIAGGKEVKLFQVAAKLASSVQE